MLSLDEAKLFLRIDNDAEDKLVNVLILLSAEMSRNYMRRELPEPLPLSVKHACLIIIAHFYEKRDGEPVPEAVYRLLDAYREERF